MFRRNDKEDLEDAYLEPISEDIEMRLMDNINYNGST